ncbi:MAG: hypothetical protein HWD59_08190 [Coxiellaceae bacterium]|nr:MAG: hypothetical protein HWD59_08190 [Coxiellaceae bacterium]
MGLFLVIFTTSWIAGCAPNISANNYNASNVGTTNKVVAGTIINARPVQVSNNTGTGGLAGGVAGAAAGSTIGGSTAVNIIGGVAGALAGGLLGNATEKQLSKQTGMEYIVKTSNGNMLSIVQGSDTQLSVGQHVMVILGSGGTPSRIIPA